MKNAVALKSTVFRAELTISDLDREVYETFSLTLARHPSETDERMMIRLLAFALEADERLSFGGGLSTEDEPDLWRKGFDGTIERWIEVGLPDPKRLKQAMGRSDAVRVVTYGETKRVPWWQKHAAELRALGNDLELLYVNDATCAALEGLTQRSMRLSVTIQDGAAFINDEEGAMVEVRPERLDPSRTVL